MRLSKTMCMLALCSVLGFAGGGHAQQAADPGKKVIKPNTVDVKKVAAQIEAEVAAFGAKSSELTDLADAIDDNVHLGSGLNEVDVPAHQCYILGRFLGLDDLVAAQKVQYDLDLRSKTSDNAQDLRIASLSMENFGHVASNILSDTQNARIFRWNLDCAGQNEIPAVFIDQQGIKPVLTVDSDGTMLRVLGDVGEGFSVALVKVLDANPGVEHIALGGAGEDIAEALKAGRLIRARGLQTVLMSSCYSACAIVFMGGVERNIWSPPSDIGFHRFSVDGKALPYTHDLYVRTHAYAKAMGMNEEFVIRSIRAAMPDAMNVVDPDDLCEARIATWVQRVCMTPASRRSH